MYVVNSQEMRAIDQYTIEQIGIPAMVLMENAGRAVADEVLRYAGERHLRIAVLVGKGNNGADGLVAARHLQEAGHEVGIIYAVDPAGFVNEASVQRDIVHHLLIPSTCYTEITVQWNCYDLIIDALLGTGSRGAPKEGVARLILEANDSGLPIYAVDIPSGLDPNTGYVHEACIRATCTIALAFTKRGLEQEPGVEQAGRVIVRSIGIPRAAAEQLKVRTFLIEEPLLSDTLGLSSYRRRPSNSNKGTFGHVLVAAGSRSMSGAGLLCAKAALRAGSGLVTWALPDSLLDGMLGQLPEIMMRGIADEGRGDWGKISTKSILELAANKAALVFGPGIGRFDNDTHWLQDIWEKTTCPLVLDADALNMLGSSIGMDALPRRTASVILTPHPGEMARLCGKTIADIQGDRIETARSFAWKFGVTLVLKGARTVIATPEGEVYINTTGNAGMATGGTGDVLAGIIAGLLAQGLSATQSAALGVYLHGSAGDRAASSRAYIASIIASDIIEQL
ncbi:NAD(P)H-hydrate epimerase [Paenibacillus sp. 1_12]|uniref:NAD(P)H-hydrate dehydratase n=1 Tax=Paenibacillus sp. 1_12 TaxID=1566278 RepID=UPI0008E5C00C|nr:NAD(P)H-hydrate dehydratase [Paenibacillus sp. 1_12]SFL43050.1 NAD(P)H-hydrate epimerase [Paenibacillus sp. 1_12]